MNPSHSIQKGNEDLAGSSQWTGQPPAEGAAPLPVYPAVEDLPPTPDPLADTLARNERQHMRDFYIASAVVLVIGVAIGFCAGQALQVA